jgi:hypothetical protein
VAGVVLLTGLALILFALWGWRVEHELKQLKREMRRHANGKSWQIDYGRRIDQ